MEWTDGGTGGGPATTMLAHSDAPRGPRRGPDPPFRRGPCPCQGPGQRRTAGDLALRAGSVVGPPQIGLLAAIGRSTVKVRPRPRVVVLSTGSELVQPGEELAEGRSTTPTASR
ncbi:hypothetical protein NKH18_21670 [Streptomyces sp. M10(2022)]